MDSILAILAHPDDEVFISGTLSSAMKPLKGDASWCIILIHLPLYPFDTPLSMVNIKRYLAFLG